MKKISYRSVLLSLFSFFLFLCPVKVFAASATLGINADSSVYVGREITATLYVASVSGANGGIESVEANLVFDKNYLEYVSGTGVNNPYSFQINPSLNYKIAGLDTSMSNGITSTTTVFTFKFKTKKTGSTTISLSNVKLTDSSNKINSNVSSKTITITDPPSSNTNLKSLSVSNGSLSFDKNRTSYDVSVGSDVTDITINGTAEDSGAVVSGTGSKNLNYGNNKFDITVKAPSGDTKTYVVNVNRKDTRNSNNNLSSLKVKDGELSPSFNKNTLEYSISVPYEVSSLKIDATAEDSKSKVNITNNSLISEETVNVKVVVTAENGSSKTYIIHAKRGKDPNKKLSNNNYLSSLTVSNGILSPAFTKEQEKYVVYLPYEIDTIDINVEVEDTKYATLNKSGDSKLSEGNNPFIFTVTAEDNSTRTYTVTVVRGINLLESNLSSNVLLEDIKIEKGRLKQDFYKNVHYYTYTGGKITAIPEDKTSKVKIIENDDISAIIVGAQNGELGVYTLQKVKSNNNMLLIGIVGILLVIFALFIGYNIGKDKANRQNGIQKKKFRGNKKAENNITE